MARIVAGPASPVVPSPWSATPRAALGAVLFSPKRSSSSSPMRRGSTPRRCSRSGCLSLPVYLAIGALAMRDRRRNGAAAGRASAPRRRVGMLGYSFASYTDFLGLDHISAQFERLILFTYPAFVVLFGALFFGQPMRARALIGIAVSYAGLALIFTANPAGSARTGGGRGARPLPAIAFALYQLLAKKSIGRRPAALHLRRDAARSHRAVPVRADAAARKHDRRAKAPRLWSASRDRRDGPAVIPAQHRAAAHLGAGERHHRHGEPGHHDRPRGDGPGRAVHEGSTLSARCSCWRVSAGSPSTDRKRGVGKSAGTEPRLPFAVKSG